MAISTYAELLSAVGNWLHRDGLSSRIPEFIALAESRVYQGSEDPVYPSPALRIRDMMQRDTGNAAAGVITFPTGYLETIRLAVSTNGRKRALEYRSPVDNAGWESESGIADYYTEVNGAIYVGPTTAAYTHDYYKAFDALTASATTNWLITNAPNIYLYGCLVEAAPFINKDERLNTWYRMFVGAIAGLQRSKAGGKRGSSGLAVKPG